MPVHARHFGKPTVQLGSCESEVDRLAKQKNSHSRVEPNLARSLVESHRIFLQSLVVLSLLNRQIVATQTNIVQSNI